ncbi:hypothetical protein C7S14_0335 [Burkholderia cepacia]|nr:hypothetical protein C7S14_0335 [Burkholderia cepacia]
MIAGPPPARVFHAVSPSRSRRPRREGLAHPRKSLIQPETPS